MNKNIQEHTRREFLCLSCIGLGSVLAPLFSTGKIQQAVAQEQSLSFQLETLAKQIEGQLIAPCCFAQTVADHYSDVAENIKRQIRQLLAQGVTEAQILNEYVRIYGERILAAPRAQGFNLLAYLLPPFSVLVGVASVGIMLDRWRRTAPLSVASPAVNAESSVPATDALRSLLEAELAEFER
jgi:cytochrome c-type biogenesis protein CcmH/NrfF